MLNMLLETELFAQQSCENFKDGDCGVSLGNLLQCFITLLKNKLFLNYSLNLPNLNCWLWQIILTTLKGLLLQKFLTPMLVNIEGTPRNLGCGIYQKNIFWAGASTNNVFIYRLVSILK